MDDATRSKLDYAYSEAMRVYLGRRSVLLCTGNPRNPHSIATGTCVRVGGRSFIATAAHPFRGVRQDDVWVCHVRDGFQRRLPIAEMVLEGGGDLDQLDLGLIRLDSKAAAAIDRDFVEVDQTDCAPTNLGEKLLYVLGYPSSLLLTERLAQGEFSYGSVCLCSFALSPESFPDRAGITRDIAFEYPETTVRGSERVQKPTPDPAGLSGGGIWLLDPNVANPLAGPHNARWVGIQRAWIPRKRVAYGNRVELWFALESRTRVS